ncbi:MAG: COX15/CtaA family protein [Actinomycetota bacterium]|nr:COX15/CtaA family protein [Actinomycetota bacterium]
MGIETGTPTAAPASRVRRLDRLAPWLAAPVALRRLALASVIANVGIVVTGGAVRLTDSGLGCPTWPTCTGSSLVVTKKLGIHGAIEFTNRTMTFLVGAVLLITLVAAWRQRREVRLAAIGLASIPAQAVLGGLVVHTDLNPWLVATHFLLSAGIVAVTFLLWWRVTDHRADPIPTGGVILARATAAVAALVLVIGTVVSGSGPHAGDVKNGRVHRIHISTSGLAQLHADAVMVLIGLSVGMLALAYALRLAEPVRRAAGLLLAVELAQGAVGYTQFFLHVPPVLVALHMLGACLVWLAALRTLLCVEPGLDGSRSP